MYVLIADSGSTKTDWILHDPETHTTLSFQSSGLNPCLMSDEQILQRLEDEVLPWLQKVPDISDAQTVHDATVNIIQSTSPLRIALYFYGAGCRSDQTVRMATLLEAQLPVCVETVASDLLGAARAVCGDHAGIVAILGTGSGSAVFDGKTFIQHTPSLGFILGDEGSGAVLGRRLLGDIFKHQLPDHLIADFERTFATSVDDAIRHVYREASPNRYLAQFVPFLESHLSEPTIQDLLVNEFRRFFYRNIRPYHRPDLLVHFVGSIASIYSRQLQKAAQDCQCQVGTILRSPVASILQYHLHHI